MSQPDLHVRIATETVRCDLCHSAADQPLMTLPDILMGTTDAPFRIVRCRRCGLIYLNPRPRTDQMDHFYDDSYAPFTRQGMSGAARNWLYRRSVRDLRRYLEAPKKVLDIGCGTGELLHAVRRAGNPNVFGIEPSANAASLARERYGLSVSTGTLEVACLESCSVDTVLLSHVLEHVQSPSATLCEIERTLRPGGSVIIWVPNADSLAANWLGRYWMGWDVPRHLYSFTPAALHRLLRNAGLEPVDEYHERHGLEWAWGFRLWARNQYAGATVEHTLKVLHPALAAGMTPLGTFAAVVGKSGRVRMIARKRVL